MKNKEFLEDYRRFMDTILEKGYAMEVPQDQLSHDDNRVWYVPHHGVYHLKKKKIRVVFDCNATFQDVPLNGQLMQGPDLTNKLIGALMRFREEPIAMMADIESMFYQVRVPGTDADLLRFLWWPNGDLSAPVKDYRMVVHLFGATSSPSVASYALRRTAEDRRGTAAPEAVETVLRNFYVDDCLKSVATEEEAVALVKSLRYLCAEGGFSLTKWVSNSRRVLSSIPAELRATELKDLDLAQDDLPTERALGVQWCTFTYRIKSQDKPKTRRGILSVVNSTYDPLGFLVPLILPAKLLMRDLCKEKLGWDEEFSDSWTERWYKWLEDLTLVSGFSISRCVKPKNFGTTKVASETSQSEKDPEKQKVIVQQNMEKYRSTMERRSVTFEQLMTAEAEIIRYSQSQCFPEEIRALCSNKPVKKSSQLYRLDPMLQDGFLRVGGRLNRAAMPAETKHPVILSKHSRVAILILNEIHEKIGHSGRNYMLLQLRQRFWIPQATSAIRKIISKCTVCRRLRGQVGEQKMAPLLEDRLLPDKPPFTNVGIDYFGPFEVKRGQSTVKRYGVMFTCLTIRAVHIEVADSLDTSACINVLRRFISRRGQISIMRSDNGTNFVGAEKELREAVKNLDQSEMEKTMQERGIKWIFNSPAASHQGGIWERQIRTVRRILGALLKEQTLTDDSLQTFLCEVESIINGRPITSVSDDPCDIEPLTPNHLLLMKTQPNMPPGIFNKDDLYARKRWRQVQYLADLFWRRWTREYLPLLQERQK
ncbi:hypothetical protein D4764_0264710 [Takifugu flavidus]|uniref:Integrase catalytic domain-containing protein n=1 Tax=Takifugu flavidus TaxID=433684 RepID=A0A5C6MMG3_9TELE|nr:hypothetical protein D4764_0264710 [Takifugu flavidus]